MAINEWYLNITRLPKISQASINYLKTLEPYKAEYWQLNTPEMNTYKEELLKKLLKIQNRRCVYCGLSLARRSRDREHFVHKAARRGYQEFMFNSDNLFAACEFCNRRLKGQKNVIKKYDPDYSKCTFTIVHPYYDIPDDFIQFQPSKEYPIKALPTNQDDGRGKLTIKMFQLDTHDMYIERMGYIAQIQAEESQFSDILQYKITQ